jgi:CCR4-NOT transcription complex subunit 2
MRGKGESPLGTMAAYSPAHALPKCLESVLNICDDREFPSLSGAPQAQQNTSAQQMWSNPNLRSAQHSTIQRPQGQSAQQGQVSQIGAQHIQTPGHDDTVGSAPGPFSAVGDDYRFGGQAGVGQLSGSSQPQTGNIDEFPPLGGSGGDVAPDRRTGLIQNAAAYGANATANAFPGLGQTRNGLSSPTEGQQDRQIGSGLGAGLTPGGGMCIGPYPRQFAYSSLASRSPFDSLRGTSTGLQDVRLFIRLHILQC